MCSQYQGRATHRPHMHTHIHTHMQTHIPFPHTDPRPFTHVPSPKTLSWTKVAAVKVYKSRTSANVLPPPPPSLMTLSNTPEEWKWWKNRTKKIGNGAEGRGKRGVRNIRWPKKKANVMDETWSLLIRFDELFEKGFFLQARDWGAYAGFAFSRFITYACFGLLDFRFRFNCNAWKLHNVSEVLRSLGPHVNAIWTAKAHTPGPAYKHASSVEVKVCLCRTPRSSTLSPAPGPSTQMWYLRYYIFHFLFVFFFFLFSIFVSYMYFHTLT